MTLLELCLWAVLATQLTSSQPTYDVIQQENDISSCGRTDPVLRELSTGMSQLAAAVSRMEVTLSQLQSEVAELKAVSQPTAVAGTHKSRWNLTLNRQTLSPGAFLGFADGRGRKEGLKGRERGWDSWGGGSQPPPHQLRGLGERCKLPQRGPGRSPGRQTVLLHFNYSGMPLLTPFLRFFDGDGGGAPPPPVNPPLTQPICISGQ